MPPVAVRFRLRRHVIVLAAGVALACAVLVALSQAVPLPARLSRHGSTVVRWQDGSIAHLTLAPDDRWRIPVTRDQVDPAYVEALVRLEDRRFWIHPGVDPLAVVRAALTDLVHGRVVSGASTLTMQVVRLCQPRPRTLRSKAIEAATAVQLELRLSKEQILSAYLDLVPMGGNLEGVEAASQAFFGHSAAHLSPAEIATLLAIPQSPAARTPRPENVARLTQARQEIAQRLVDLGLLERHLAKGAGDGDVTVAQALARISRTPVPTGLRPMPRAIPHAVAWMLGGRHDQGLDLATTLDRGVQDTAERVLAARTATLRVHGIDDAAIVVVDYRTSEVRALVGGTDFWAHRAGAQIPAFAAPRSPGSALKPLLYARALDRGLILPQRLVLDVPVHYGGYAPENYDGTHQGLVSMRDALSRSLNVPFVQLLQRVGVEPFLGDLRMLGVRSLDPRPGHYGLSAIVGGIEVSPLDVAGIYATLARGGRARDLRWRLDQPPAPELQVLAPGAVWLTARDLARKDRPDFPARQELSAVPRYVRWKTGTSFGNRDAWAVGWGRRYVVAVWLGNLDCRPSSWLVGAQVAGPVLFDLVDALQDGFARDPGAPATAPRDLAPVQVCALSGKLAGPYCPDQKTVLALSAHVPPDHCDLHMSIELDDETGARVGPGCRAGRPTHHAVRVRWPGAVRRWLSATFQALPTAPPWDPSCPTADPGGAPAILTPEADQVAVLIPGVSPDRQEIPLQADARAGPLTWFVDGVRLAAAELDQAVWWTPIPGEHEVLVMDAQGRSDRVRLRVRQGGASLLPGP